MHKPIIRTGQDPMDPYDHRDRVLTWKNAPDDAVDVFERHPDGLWHPIGCSSDCLLGTTLSTIEEYNTISFA